MFILYSFIISIPFWVYLLLFFVVLGVSIYSYYDMKAKYHDNPMVWILPFMVLVFGSFVVYKYALDFTSNLLFQQTMMTVTLVCFGLFILSFVITLSIVSKKSYANKKLEKKMKPIVIICFGISTLLLVLLEVMDRFF